MKLNRFFFLLLLLSLSAFACDDGGEDSEDLIQDQQVDQGLDESDLDEGDAAEVSPDLVELDEQESLDQVDLSDGEDEQSDLEETTDLELDGEPLDVDDQLEESTDAVDSADVEPQELPLAGFGELSGACDVLDEAVWASSEAMIFRNTIDFGSTSFDESLLSSGAQTILEEGTAGGSSGNSEAISYDVLYRCELADLLLTETVIEYTSQDTSITDYLSSIDDRNTAVSVTRAFHYPPSEPCVVDDMVELLEKKLGGALEAEANAHPDNPWDRSILSVMAYNSQCADAVEAAFELVSADVKGDTIIYLTVTEGADEFIY